METLSTGQCPVTYKSQLVCQSTTVQFVMDSILAQLVASTQNTLAVAQKQCALAQVTTYQHKQVRHRVSVSSTTAVWQQLVRQNTMCRLRISFPLLLLSPLSSTFPIFPGQSDPTLRVPCTIFPFPVLLLNSFETFLYLSFLSFQNPAFSDTLSSLFRQERKADPRYPLPSQCRQ